MFTLFLLEQGKWVKTASISANGRKDAVLQWKKSHKLKPEGGIWKVKANR